MPWGELAGAACLVWLALYPLADLAGRRLQVNALIGDGRALTVALTYDIESRRQWEEILADLRAAGAPATLFVTGQLALQHPDLARQTREEGHVLGSRGFTGKSPGRLSPWAAVADISRGRAAVGAAAGAYPKWYRPGPGHESLFSVWGPAWFGLRRVLGQVRVTPAHQDPARFVARFAFAGVVVRFEAGAVRPGLAGEVAARLQAEGLAVGRLEELHPETSLVRRGWYWWEGEFTRRYDVETLAASDGGPPMLRLGVSPYRGFPLIADGAELLPGTPMAELHFVNQTLAQDSVMPARAVHVAVRLRRAFSDAARAIRDDPRYAACQAAGGVTVLDVGDAIGRMGLHRTPARGVRMWFMRIYLVFLMGVFHRQGFRVFRRFGRLRPVWVWLPRDAFIERFASKGRSARG